MATDEKTIGKEPQSYGSSAEWVSGKTGQTVDATPQKSSRHDEAFYEDRHHPVHTSEEGGQVNDVQLAESDGGGSAGAKVTGSATGHPGEDDGQRKSYWRERDYK